jgi:hypothetical protein
MSLLLTDQSVRQFETVQRGGGGGGGWWVGIKQPHKLVLEEIRSHWPCGGNVLSLSPYQIEILTQQY